MLRNKYVYVSKIADLIIYLLVKSHFCVHLSGISVFLTLLPSRDVTKRTRMLHQGWNRVSLDECSLSLVVGLVSLSEVGDE